MKIDQSSMMDTITKGNDAAAPKGIDAYLLKEQERTSGIGAAGVFQKTDELAGVSESGSVHLNDATYMKPGTEEAKTAADTLEGSMATDSETRKNQMVVLASTTSADDYMEMEKQGFSLSETDSHTIITVTDKIKTTLAAAGVDISGYGDTPDAEQMEKITGSAAIANQIEQKLKENDLPVKGDTVNEMEDAYEKAASMTGVNDATMSYLIRNEKEPTIANVYKAQYSSANSKTVSMEEAKTEYSELEQQISRILEESGMTVDEQNISNGKWLIANELPLNAKNLNYLSGLQNLSVQMKQSQAISGQETGASPQTDIEKNEWILDAEAEAVAEGRSAADGYLIPGFSLWDQAAHGQDIVKQATDEDLRYCQQNQMPLTIANLELAQKNRKEDTTGQKNPTVSQSTNTQRTNTQSANTSNQNTAAQNTANTIDNPTLLTYRRQLEETRLLMTSQANYALLKKGIAIDTKPLEQLVNDLKEQEQSYYSALLTGADTTEIKEGAALASQTNSVVESLKWQPAYVLTIEHADENTLQSLYEDGEALQKAFEKAGKAYETLWTAPRADMGDSMKKAFQNVDDILTDLGLETTEENRRAVRILAYNKTELTKENLDVMKQADETVQRTFSNMTPAVTLEMIRQGINPLEMNLSELNAKAEDIKKEMGYDDTERFSKFLWKLEHKNGITQEERESFMGIYRLISQVEKTDGAVIGSLVQQDAELSMKNLLTAVRSRNKGNMEYEVDDEFGGVDGKRTGTAIDEQIYAAYQNECLKDVKENLNPSALMSDNLSNWESMTPEQMKEAMQQVPENVQQEDAVLDEQYAQEEIAQFDEVLQASDEVYQLLDRIDMPNTILNVMAASRMMRNPNQMFRKLFQQTDGSEDITIADLKEQVLEQFSEAVKSPEAMADAQENLADVAENVMKTMIIERKDASAVDLKELRILNQQFTLCAKRTEEESYMIPMQTGDTVTGVSLKIVRGTEDKGLVDILFRGELMGKVAASFQATATGVSGMIATDNQETRQLLSNNLGLLASMINEDGNEPMDVSVAYVEKLDLDHYERNTILSYTKDSTGAVQSAQADATTADATAADDSIIVTSTSTSTNANTNANADTTVQTRRLYHIAEKYLETIRELTE